MEEMWESEVVFNFFFFRLPLCLALPLSRFIIIVCASLCVCALYSTTQTENSKDTRARVHIKNWHWQLLFDTRIIIEAKRSCRREEKKKERSKRIIGPAKSERKRKKKKKKTRSHFLALYYFRNTKRTEWHIKNVTAIAAENLSRALYARRVEKRRNLQRSFKRLRRVDERPLDESGLHEQRRRPVSRAGHLLYSRKYD